jgi:SSS family solute:Na+ symporter
MKIHLADVLVIIAYFIGTLWLGLHFSKRQKSTKEYFLAGSAFSGWVLGISLIGSIISSQSFIAGPADTFKTAYLRFVPNLAIPIAAVTVAIYIVPFFRRSGISSAYDYLSQRFSPVVSGYAACVFVVLQLFRVSVVVHLFVLVCVFVTGLTYLVCLLLVGGITAIYTIKGGYRAVIWTDVAQAVILVIGGLAAIWIAVQGVPGGLSSVVSEAWQANKLSFWDLNTATATLEPTGWHLSFSEKTVTCLFIVGFTFFLGGTLDQANVQRWCSARTTKDAQFSLLVVGFGAIPIWMCFLFLGTCLFVFFQHHADPVAQEILAGERLAEQIMPHFIVAYIPPGMTGLVISGVMAAAMSTLSACINSSSMVIVNDIYRAFIRKSAPDGHYLMLGKVASVIVSLLMIGGALLINAANAKTLTDLIMMFGAVVGGTVPGIFLLGMLTPRRSTKGLYVAVGLALVFVGYGLAGNFGLLPENIRMPIDIYYYGLISNTFIVAFGALWPGEKVAPRLYLSGANSKAVTPS